MRPGVSLILLASTFFLACATGSQIEEVAGATADSSGTNTTSGTGSPSGTTGTGTSSTAGSGTSSTAGSGTSSTAGSGTSSTSGASSGSTGAGASGGGSTTTGSGGVGTATGSGGAGTTSGSGGSGTATGPGSTAASSTAASSAAASSSTGSGGAGGCTTNTDGDGLDDCAETNDGDPWTDPSIFNGMHVRWAEQCSSVGSCSEVDTLAEVNACANNPMIEQKDQYSGWDWDDPPNGICSAGYNFQPNWTQCNNGNADTWSAQWKGYINLTQSGNHCFDVTGSNSEGCAAIYFNTETSGATNSSAAKCYNQPAGVYPIHWFYTMDNGSSSDMHVVYCFGGGVTCTPAVAIPATMLRVSP